MNGILLIMGFISSYRTIFKLLLLKEKIGELLFPFRTKIIDHNIHILLCTLILPTKMNGVT